MIGLSKYLDLRRPESMSCRPMFADPAAAPRLLIENSEQYERGDYDNTTKPTQGAISDKVVIRHGRVANGK